MDDPLPQPIHSLITALDAAIARLGEATSLKQRKARNQVCVNRGLALHERLGELRVWLNEHDEDDRYLGNLAKYEEGWDALNAAMEYTREYKRLHWEEINEHNRHRPRRRTGHNPHPPSSKDRAESPPPEADGGATVRDADAGTQRALL
jgi:hypothetical protein